MHRWPRRFPLWLFSDESARPRSHLLTRPEEALSGLEFHSASQSEDLDGRNAFVRAFPRCVHGVVWRWRRVFVGYPWCHTESPARDDGRADQIIGGEEEISLSYHTDNFQRYLDIGAREEGWLDLHESLPLNLRGNIDKDEEATEASRAWWVICMDTAIVAGRSWFRRKRWSCPPTFGSVSEWKGKIGV